MPIIHRIREFNFRKPTTDNWAPSFDDGTMECRGFVLRVMKNKEEAKALAGNNWWSKIILSGDDDYCLEKEFHGTRMECIDFFQREFNILIKMSIVNQKEAKEMGYAHL